ncbi:non-ribosomal peptide synthase domain TIGR01720/amino acid adenylation domain-containing protein [Pseudomonas sp. UC 17F4]|uniref:amino acid adenylation domain-containing protein n=1 Tax=Pseudomonas sp. UC 17F4 TaxID=1855328 RepID=UPI0008905175|nr:non-ribosomal peptide synthase domain TIGR01720/amino acid adenylation domain-containing protein [Pseudomonas sp. UC 17F4]
MQELIGAVGALSSKERKALAILLKQKGINLFNVAPIFKRKADEPLLLSYAQERQWFLWQMEPDSANYHIPLALRLRGELDLGALQRSVEALHLRHEALRTTFVDDDLQALQVVHPSMTADFTCLDWSNEPASARSEARLKAFVEEQVGQLFDLRQGPLLRVCLLRLDVDDHVLLLIQHHIVSDGWSMEILLREIIEYYSAFTQGRAPDLAPLPIQYADYALWQRQWMEAGERERQLAYWTAQLGSEHPLLELPTDRPRPAEQSYRGARLALSLPDGLADALKRFAGQENVTLFTLLLSSFELLLHRYSGQAEIRVGVPSANRNRVETEGLIGFFVNTQVIKACFDDQLTFRQLLQAVHQTVLDAQTHQDLPFEQLVEALRPERSLSHSPLFQVMYNHQSDARTRHQLAGQGGPLTIEALAWEKHTAQFDLMLDTHDSPSGLAAGLTYASDLFERATVERMAAHWLGLLQAIVQQPDQRVAAMPLLDSDQWQQQVVRWNDTAMDYPLACCVHQLIEQQAQATPDRVALVLGAAQLSYRQLNEVANQWAHRLLGAGVGPDVLVGIAAERSLEMVIGLLAVLKAGGAYVPLDPDYPAERLAYMMQDSGMRLLLTQQSVRERLPVPADVECLLLDQPQDGWPVSNPACYPHPQNLAYVIYTSGSTGKPKGAANRHLALTNRLCWMQQAYGLGEQDRVLQKTPFSFDVSVWEFFWPLMTGARLVLAAPGDHKDPARLIEVIRREQITTLHFVPSMLQVFMLDDQAGLCTSLSRVICSGEALPADAQQQVLSRLPQASLYNLYGPTEAAIDVTHWTCRDEGRDSVPIGQPIANLGTYVLDDELTPVPVGVTGELYLAGIGLARGYHRRPGLSAERFVVSPFASGERMYRTGDLARQRSDGVIEYRGRIDHQVKIRGLRIELGEIEARLLEQDEIHEAVVLAVATGNGQQLVAYLVPARRDWPGDDRQRQAQARELLRSRLLAALPDYMVPSQLMFLDSLPLSPNGKLERRALPVPDAEQMQQAYVAPGSAVEVALAALWQEVLKVERVGLNDNFFELGGDSIVSIQLVSRARRQGIVFTPKELFQHQTVQSLAAVARSREVGEVDAVDQGLVSGAALLLPIHQAFFASDIPQRHQWNQSVLLKPSQPLQADLLERALQALVMHHDVLRSCFSAEQVRYLQPERLLAHWAQAPLLWQTAPVDLAALSVDCDEAQRSLQPAQGQLLRALLATLADGQQRLLLVVHHLAVDGVSWRILFEDLQQAYTQLAAGQPVALPAKTTSVKAWAERLQTYARGDNLQAQLGYWQQQLQGACAELPQDHADGTLRSRDALTLYSQLSPQLTRKLLQQAPAAYRTQINDLLLAALARVLQRWTGADHCLIQLEGHGREELFDEVDLTRTLGWFTSMFALKLQAFEQWSDTLKGIKEQLRAVPDKGIGYGVLRYLGDQQARESLAQLPVPRVTFNYLGQFDASFSSDQALFVPAAENRGLERSLDAPLGNWLSLNGQVYDSALSIGWTFSRSMFDEATIAHLAAQYSEELERLIEHCCDQGVGAVTPSDFPLAQVSQAWLDQLPIAAGEIEDIYPLSPMQQGMLLHTLEDNESALYINQVQLPVQGLDVERFCQAWQAAIDRHEALRTSFHWPDRQTPALQVVQRRVKLHVQTLDWQDQPWDEQRVAQCASAERARGFDIGAAPLLRLLLIGTGPGQYRMIWTSHHILMDGWSNSRLLAEVLQHYCGAQVAAPGGRFRDFIGWLQGQDAKGLEQFWKQRLQALVEPTSLSQAVHPRHSSSEPGHRALYTRWDAARTARLQQVCRDLRITPNTLIQGAWLLLLQRYTRQDTVVFGATVAGRPEGLANADTLLGLFINTLPVIHRIRPEQALDAWLRDLQAYNLDVRDHSHVPLADIQRWAGMGGQALFDSIIVFENYPIDERLGEARDSGLHFGESRNHDVTNFPMDLAVHLNDSLSIEYLHLRSAFSEQAVEGIRHAMEGLLTAMLETPLQRVGNLQRLDTAQWQQLQAWGAQPARQYRPLSVVELIDEQARRQPGAIAVECAGQRLDYAALQRQSNALAATLMAQGAGPEVLLGVALERSPQMIVALLAVLKCGAAYVPLDIDYPSERLAYMIEDSGMALVITHSDLLGRLPLPALLPRVEMDRLPLDEQRVGPALACGDDRNLAYLIYTSGSTGQPKGVAVTRGPLSMHCQAIIERYEMNASTRELHFMSFAFDGAHERWLSVLGSGGALVIRDAELWTPEQTFKALGQQAITIACFPPAYLKQVAEYARQCGEPAPAVNIYCFGGDAVPEQTFELVKAALRPQYFTNGYGPTETVVTPLLWKVPADSTCEAAYAPIGRAIGLRALQVLDDDLNPLPAGFAGELYIGGEGVARGYHRRPGLTAERFVPDPFGQPGTRAYRSGDLVRLREDGIIDYVGRIDHQVKIRGFRIELGEVEACLRQQPGVSDALVIARDFAAGKRLIAYAVTPHGIDQGPALLSGLRAVLPDYMVPAQVICLAALPISLNGKLDRKALPEPDFSADSYLAPRSEQEHLLAQVWAEVLQVDRVGISDNFFELGGDSILSLQVISRVRNHPQLDINLKLRDLMRYQTIAGLFDQQVFAGAAQQEDLSHRVSDGRFSLLPIQEWFFAQNMPEAHHFNQALMLRSRQALDPQALEQALQAVVQQHDGLRLCFAKEGERWYQAYRPQQAQADKPLLEQVSVADEAALEDLTARVQRSLDLQQGPLMRALQITFAGEQRLLLVIHHLAIDTVSWRILLQDLQQAYEACSQGNSPALPIRTSSYQAWATRLEQQAPLLVERELGYWLEQLQDSGQPFPCDNPRGKNLVGFHAVERMELDAQRTSELLTQVPAVYQTQINDLLLGALSRVLCRWSGQDAALIQLEGHGREDLFDELDLSRSLGWFTSMYPVRLVPGAEGDIRASLLGVQRQLAAVPDKGLGYGVLRYLAGNSLRQQFAGLAQARVTFNYLGQFDQSFDERALLVPAEQSVGACYSLQAPLGNWLEIVGQVFDGRLALRCVFSTRRYRRETIRQLMDDYQRELQAIISHCLAQAA